MIKYSIRGENIEVTEAIREYVETKLSKVEKYFN
ncbi:ribosome-associated factor Y, partial [Streptococcus agalactiae]|nr:ribosome-associated factor Y [Streptococcus agalactiae]